MQPINESLQEIDSDHWVIANHLTLSRQCRAMPNQPSWSDSNGGFFVLSDTSHVLPLSRPLSETAEIRKVYDAGTVSAVWKVGEAFIKVKRLMPDTTREHITLDYLHTKDSLSFNIPTVYYHTEVEGRYIIVLSCLPGKTLADAWLSMSGTTQNDYVRRIANICNQLTAWNGNAISGVDGNYLSDLYLCKNSAGTNFEPHNLLNSCQALGMDCSSLVFYHCDLGPGNIIINPKDGSIGIIDWETAGYVPKDWIRTKFRLSSGMDLPVGSDDARREWRRKVAQRLGEMGFLEVAERWSSWWSF